MKELTRDERDTFALTGQREHIRRMVDEIADRESVPLKLLRSVAAKSRLADLGEQSSALAHELRQPLFTIAMVNENLRLLLTRPDFDRERLQKAVERSAEQVRRAQIIIERTLAYATENSGAEPEWTDAATAAERATGFLAEMFDGHDIIVDRELPHGDATVRVCWVEMEQVFVNVLRNAVESIVDRRRQGWDGQGRIAIAVEIQGENVRCTVQDNGVGLPAGSSSDAPFQPFFTTKPDEGTGLGLHICRQIVAKAGGCIQLMPAPTEGALVEIRMARAERLPASGVIAA